MRGAYKKGKPVKDKCGKCAQAHATQYEDMDWNVVLETISTSQMLRASFFACGRVLSREIRKTWNVKDIYSRESTGQLGFNDFWCPTPAQYEEKLTKNPKDVASVTVDVNADAFGKRMPRNSAP